jgi:hypothetical protein
VKGETSKDVIGRVLRRKDGKRKGCEEEEGKEERL